jgi:electron transfer flavoprotein beta subunit
MKILVCVKEVPDRDSRYQVAVGGRWIDEQQVSFVTSECDEYALEEALRLKEAHGGEVVLLSVGNARTEKVLRKGLAMGADRGILIVDERKPIRGPFETAAALAEILHGEGFDLVLAGTQSDDFGSGQTAIILAEFLGVPHASIAMQVEIDPSLGTVKVLKEMESGTFQSLRLPLPAVVGVQAGSSPIRFVSLKGIMLAKKKEIVQVPFSQLGIESEGMPSVQVERLYVPEVERRAEILEGEPDQVVDKLVEKLRFEAKVLS